MTDMITSFFDDICSAPQPAMKRVKATIRLDIENGGRNHGGNGHHYLLDSNRGELSVAPTKRGTAADVVIRVRQELFEQMISGRANAMAAMLRGEIGVEGDGALLVAFQRLLPGPTPPSQSTKDGSL